MQLGTALTDKQQKILDFIESFIEAAHHSPTLAEIATHLNINTRSTVLQHLAALEKKGFIKRLPKAYRGIVLMSGDQGTIQMPFYEIPFKGYVAAGQPIEAIEANGVVQVPQKLVPFPSRPHFALQVVGESMIEDGIYDGEIAIIEARHYAENGDLVVAKDENNNVTLKYFYREKNRIRLEPRNKRFSPLYPQKVEILGLLRGITTWDQSTTVVKET